MSQRDHLDYTATVDDCQPLSDKDKAGKERPWAEHRSSAELLSMVYSRINGRKARRVRDCSPLLGFVADPDTGAKRLKTAWFCRVRLCPVCQWRRSLKMYGQAVQVIGAADADQPHGWIMLTLTVRSVDGCDLNNELDLLMDSWRRLTRSADWRQRVLGSMRSVEVTHNIDLQGGWYDTYHPHIHALLCVPLTYFNGHNYLSRARWARLWKTAAQLDYDPQVWVSRVKGDDPHALAEVTKYATKPGDYILPDDLDLMETTVEVLDQALAKRRLVSWQGNLKKIKAQLGLDDTEDGDLIHTGEDGDVLDQEHIAFYQWMANRRQYYAVKEVEKSAKTQK